MNSYEAILFDVDDTLVDFEKSEKISLKNCHENHFKEIVELSTFIQDFNRINRSLWSLVEKGERTPSHVVQERFILLSEHYDLPLNADIAHQYDDDLVKHSHWIEGATDVLDVLKQRSIKIGFVTNGSNIQRAKGGKLDFARYSEVFAISAELGFSKPHPQIFLHALNQIKVNPSQTLMVGDSLTSDGEGAKKSGMAFCWYNPKNIQNTMPWQPEMVISTLTALL